MCLNAPEEDNNIQNKSETKPESEPETKVNEKRARYEDAVLQHVDVMKNRLSPIQSSPLSGGFCTSTSEILVIVLRDFSGSTFMNPAPDPHHLVNVFPFHIKIASI